MSIQRCCPPAEVSTEDFESQAALLKAIADPYRLIMLATLAATKDEVCVCDFTDALPLNQPTVSHHLRILREAGLVTCERRGTWVYYTLAADAHDRLSEALTDIFRQKVNA
ncbi:MAG: metalloregulator ArsR/SmtB family transcription factor [Candidatus Eremiobacteraeota bacterium]|nr:metalloregulator ArsR/SmtB family transcription factor [Candidatus Eremiobacteraeota bacterium]